MCDHEDINEVPTGIDISSFNVPSSSISYNQGLIPIVTTEIPSSPINSSSPEDGRDHVVPAPVLNRIKKDCELKEEFLKRPNLPNYLSPPPPQSTSNLNQDRGIGGNNCETPVLPPLASPEIDILTSPQHKALHTAGVQHHPGSPAMASDEVSHQNYSPSQHLPNSNAGFARNHDPTEDRFDSHHSLVHSQEDPLSRYERADNAQERQYLISGHSQGKYSTNNI